MKLSEYVRYDALGLAELVRSRAVQPAELVEVAFSAIEATNGELNAVVDLYRAEAGRALANGLPDGPFRGVPFLVKDLCLTHAGTPTTMGSRLFGSFPSPADSELMARYRRAGLVTLGRTNVPELGLSFTTEPLRYGPTLNPWGLEYSAGGSSGGAAAAVTSRMVPAAHGNDAGGSLRVPASCCGLFALKPTRGRTPAGPTMGELIFGLAVEHVLTRSVRDSAALLDVTAGEDAGAPYTASPPARPFLAEVSTPPQRLRIAVTDESFNGVPVAAECRGAVSRAAQLCSELGHEVVEARPSISWEGFRAAYYGLMSAFVAQLLEVACARLRLAPTPDLVERSNLAIAERGRAMRAVDLAMALSQRDQISRKVGAFFGSYDLLLTPTLAICPPRIGELDLNRPGLSGDEVLDLCFAPSPFTPIFNLTGNPAMSVPLHRTPTGLPVGVHFVARSGGEATLLRLAGQLEQAAPWWERRPPVAAG